METAALYVVTGYIWLCVIVLAVGKFMDWKLRKLREKLLQDRDEFVRRERPWEEN